MLVARFPLMMATTVGRPVLANDGDNDPLTYTLDATSDASFSIDSNGQLTTDVELDFDGTQVYTVTVSVSDGKDADGNDETTPTDDDTITVTVTVENVESDDTVANNDPEFVDGSSTARDVVENALNADVGRPVSADDGDRRSPCFS
jgi:hypothetical protein